MRDERDGTLLLRCTANPVSPRPEPLPGDRDRDGIPDATDLCPNIAENRDGYEDEDGCPELAFDHDDCGSFISARRIGFFPGGASLPATTTVLDHIVAELRTRDDIELVDLVGNTRNGDGLLGRARAKTVMEYLVAHGIARTRLPIATPRADVETHEPIEHVALRIIKPQCASPGGSGR